MPGNFRTELSFLSFRSGWLCDKIDDDDDDDLPLPSRALRRCTSISTLGSALVLAPKVFSSIVLPPRASAARGTAVVCTRGGDNLIDLNARGPQRFLIYGCRLKLTQAPFRFEPSSYWGRHLEGSAAASAQYEELCGDTRTRKGLWRSSAD